MGFLSRMLVPRGIRRAAHPVRTTKSAFTPKSIRTVRRAAHPFDNMLYGAERRLNTKPRRKASSYTHGSCPVKHRSAEAARKCRNK